MPSIEKYIYHIKGKESQLVFTYFIICIYRLHMTTNIFNLSAK